ncbi:hypothetical protein SNEBB_005755 [Seison nebaliae]|nr:hypothetical protein SNEBB_005755 [Seison nebaliae]
MNNVEIETIDLTINKATRRLTIPILQLADDDSDHLRGFVLDNCGEEMTERKDYRRSGQLQKIWKYFGLLSNSFIQTIHNKINKMFDISRLQSMDEWKDGRKLGKDKKEFFILKLMDNSKFGQIYLSYSLKKKEFFICKLLNLQKILLQRKSSNLSENDKILSMLKERIFTEYYCLILAQQHPHLVCGYSAFIAQPFIYFTMKYYGGGTLKRFLSKNHKRMLNFDVILYIATSLFAALNFLHSHHIIHRDVKPENIFIDVNGEICLGDFGEAKIIHKQLPYAEVVGTLYYMAPECSLPDIYAIRECSNGKLLLKNDHRIDFYSTGIVLWEVSIGENPLRKLDEYYVPSFQSYDAVFQFMNEKIESSASNEKNLIRNKIIPHKLRKLMRIFTKMANPQIKFRYNNIQEIWDTAVLSDYVNHTNFIKGTVRPPPILSGGIRTYSIHQFSTHLLPKTSSGSLSQVEKDLFFNSYIIKIS